MGPRRPLWRLVGQENERQCPAEKGTRSQADGQVYSEASGWADVEGKGGNEAEASELLPGLSIQARLGQCQ